MFEGQRFEFGRLTDFPYVYRSGSESA